MDSNSSPDQTIFNMQQRLAQLEQMIQQAQPSAEPSSSSTNPTAMDMNDTSEQVSDLHSLQVRPSYTWTPPEFLTELLSLDEPLFTSSILTDDERKKTIERYPPVENLHYQPPDTVPVAARKMNRYQTKQDMSLKKLQYLISGVFRPLDVLGLEISKDDNQDNAQRYLYMLADCRSLLLNVATQINELRNNTTNQSYKPGQLLFLQWALDNNISQTEFSAIDLINFLSDMFSSKGYAVTIIQLFRSAVTHLHNNPQSLRENQDLNEFITTILNQAPPIRLHKSTINLQPTFTFLKNIENGTTSLAELQSKLAFLLAVTCFLRPSDLHRIPINSMKIENNNTELSFDVNCPKEKRDRRMIVKIFQVKAHQEPHLCPVNACSVYLQKRPACTATTLFFNSLRPNNPISVRTIQRWLTKLLHLSTSENRVSIRSIASSLALQVGIPKEGIVTLGNWTSSTFENHYRREHLSQFDFTNSLISYMNIDNSDDNEEFFDAEDMNFG